MRRCRRVVGWGQSHLNQGADRPGITSDCLNHAVGTAWVYPAEVVTVLAALDLGGTNIDVVVADPGGAITRAVTLPWTSSDKGLAGLLAAAGVEPRDLSAIALTGGRHRALSGALAEHDPEVRERIVHVDEPVAIGRGGLISANVARALVVSMGTGTAFVGAGPDGFRHMGGTAIGGGTVLGLARLLLGTTDPARVGDLAAMGDARAVDLSVGDIAGGRVGIVPAEMTASHFGRVARGDDKAITRPEDIAAGLLELTGQALGRLGLMAARAQGYDMVVLTGHLLDWPGIPRAVQGVAGAFGGAIVVPSQPGFSTARGALAALLDR